MSKFTELEARLSAAEAKIATITELTEQLEETLADIQYIIEEDIDE